MVVEHHLGCVEVYQDLRSNHIGEVTILGSNMVEFRPQCNHATLVTYVKKNSA